jgi:hypothetical protein
MIEKVRGKGKRRLIFYVGKSLEMIKYDAEKGKGELIF